MNLILKGLCLFATLILFSCSGSVKGKWSESDKQSFRTDMEGIQELESLGDNKTKWIECYLSKCENTFSSYFQANADESGCEKVAIECNAEVLSNGSVKGKWSEVDKQSFRSDMNDIEVLSSFGENKLKWIDCYLSKCEANFASYYHANSDEKGCEKIAEDCNRIINNSIIK